MTKESKIILTLLIVFIGAIRTNASIKMITGFEKSEMESKITGVYSNNQITEITDSGFTYSAYVGGIPLYRWAIRNDIKTEGTNALRYKVEYIGYNSSYHTFNWTPYWTYYYPTASNWGRQAMPIMYPHGWFENFPYLRDWSQHTKLWIDVYVKPAAVSLTSAKLQVAIEDEDITPPVMRQYNIPVNSWVTLEVNLKQAVAERKLKLSEIVNFWVLGFANSTVHLDNIRLAQDSDTTSLPTFKDSASMALPVLQPISTVNPVPQGKPNRTALSTITTPITIDSGMLVPSGFIGAFDNDHLFVTFNRFQGMAPANAALRMKQPLLTVQSSNGGASWGKMDSVRYPGPTPNVKWNFDHGSGRGNVVDMWGNSAWVSNTQGCTGFTPEPRQHVHLFDIADTSWSIRAGASMMDADVRHCGHSSSPIVRQRFGAKAGRLWASYGNHGRMHAPEVGVSYSDDNGATWSTAKMGFGPIEGSRQAVWYAGNYDMPETHIVPYKEHAAVFWQDARGLLWSVFNGTDWSTPEVIESNGWLSGGLKYAVHAVSMGQNEIFVTDLKMNGILHWNGSAWIRELSNVPGGGQFSVCGDGVNPENDRLIYFTAGDGKSKKPLLAYRRTATGSWEEPFNVSGDSIKVDTYNGWIGISAQPYSPPNFAPVAWSADSVIKMVKVPPADYMPSTSTPFRTTVKNILSSSINITPNPVNISASASITAGRGIVKIFSADGKVVFSRIVKTERETISWNTKGLSSGVYLISLNTGDTKVTKHMTVLR